MSKPALFLLALFIALPLAGFGCGPKASPTIDTFKGEAEYEWGDTGTKVRVGEDVDVPSDFPDDVPLYPNAPTRSVSYNPEQGLHGFIVQVTNDDPGTVIGWFAGQMPQKGWTQTAEYNMDETKMMMFSQGQRVITISSAPAEDEDDYETLITITVTEMDL